MAQKIKQASIAGRIGTGIGQGIAQQFPEELKHYQRVNSINQLKGQFKGNPLMEQYLNIASMRGITPQETQTFGDLARSQMQAEALKNYQTDQNKPVPFPTQPNQTKPEESAGSPTVTKPSVFEKSQQGYIPPTIDERRSMAAQRYTQNPGFYQNNPQLAIQEVDQEIQAENQRQDAFDRLHNKLTGFEDNIKKRLSDQSKELGVEIPAPIYQDIQDRAIQSILPKSEGGKGLTDQQAIREYGKELDEISREYKALDSIGGLALLGRKSESNLNALESSRKKFKERDDLRNFEAKMTGSVGTSPMFSAAFTYPVSEYPIMNQALKTISPVEKNMIKDPGLENFQKESDYKTMELTPVIAHALKKSGANPLSVAFELKRKGLNPDLFLRYIIENQNELDLKPSQTDGLSKPNATLLNMNDWWLENFTGIK